MFSPGFLDWLYGATDPNVPPEYPIPAMPTLPKDTVGFPVWSESTNITMGYGKPSTTRIPLSASGRSWGVSQGHTLYSEADLLKSLRKSKNNNVTKECDHSYVMVTLLPQINRTDG